MYPDIIRLLVLALHFAEERIFPDETEKLKSSNGGQSRREKPLRAGGNLKLTFL